MTSPLLLIRRQISAMWRFRWYAVLLTWLVCAVGWAVVWRIPNQYESSGRMYVDADAVLTPLLRGIAVDSTTQSQLETLQRTLLSRPNLERLISKTDLELENQGPSDRQAMVERLANEIRLVRQTGSLFTLSYRNRSPRLAYDVVRTMLAIFVESKTGNNRSDMENASRFINDQIASYERQLREHERRRAEFRARYAEVLPGDGGVSKLEVAQATVRSLQGQLQDALARRATLSRELAATPQMVATESDGPGGGTRANRLQTAERALQEMRLRYTENHPDVVSLRNLVAAIRAGTAGPASDPPSAEPRPAARNRSTSNPVYEQLKLRNVENESAIASLERQVAEAIKERDRMEEIVRGAPGLQAEYVNMNRDYEVLRKNYDDLIARRESMRIANAAETNADKVKVQIIDPPQVPENPVAPKRVLLLSGVLLAGLGAGAGLAFLLAQFDQSFRSTDDLRDLGFPIVGGVSLLAAVVPLGRRVASLGVFLLAVLIPGLVYGGLVLRALQSGRGVLI